MSEEAYAEASSPFLRWYTMRPERCFWRRLSKKRSLPGVMNVMADPRRLLTAYNDCGSGSTLPSSFDPALAEQVAHLGKSKSK